MNNHKEKIQEDMLQIAVKIIDLKHKTAHTGMIYRGIKYTVDIVIKEIEQ